MCISLVILTHTYHDARFRECIVYLKRAEMHTEFWWEDPREGDHWKDLGVDGKIILIWIFKKYDGEAWTGLLWLRIGTGGGRL